MATANQNAQGLVLALFNASAGGNLANLAPLASTASATNALGSNLVAVAALVTGKNLSDNTTFRDTLLSNLQIASTSSAYANAKAWVDGQLATPGTDKGTIAGTAVTYLLSLTDATNPYYSVAQKFQARNDVAVTWSTSSAGSAVLSATALIAQQASVDNYVAPPPPVVTTSLTSSVTDNLVGSSAGDTFTGSYSNLASTNTLQSTDKIDGVAGSDVLQLSLGANWGGFSTGGTKNVQTIQLTNSTSSALSFDATGIVGATSYAVTNTTGSISLSNLATGVNTFTINGGAASSTSPATTSFTTSFISGAPEIAGSADVATLSINATGAAAVGTTNRYNAITLNNYETVNVVSTGSNYVAFTDASTTPSLKTLNVSGSGALTLSLVPSSLTAFDASAATGNVTATFIKTSSTGANVYPTALATIKTGSGDDTVTATVGSLTGNAVIDEGTGTNKLVLTNSTTAATTVQYALKGVQTVEIRNNNTNAATTTGYAVTFSGGASSGITTITDPAYFYSASDTSYVNMGAIDLTVNANGYTSSAGTNYDVGGGSSGTTNNAFSVDNSGALTLNLNAPSGTVTAASTASTPYTNYTFANTNNLTVNVGGYIDTSNSTVTANKASNLTLNVLSGQTPAGSELSTFNSNYTGNLLTSFNVNATGKLGTSSKITAPIATTGTVTNGASTGTLQLATPSLTTLNVTASNTLDLSTGSSDLSGLQTFTGSISKGLLTLPRLYSANSITLSGTGTTSAVTINGPIGTDRNQSIVKTALSSSATAYDNGYDFNLTATGLRGNLTVASGSSIYVTPGNKVNINASAVTGDVSIGTIGETSTSYYAGDVSVSANTSTSNLTVGNVYSTGTVVIDGSGSKSTSIGSVIGNSVTLKMAGTNSYTTTITAKTLADITYPVLSSGNTDTISLASGATASTVKLTGGLGDDIITITSASSAQTSITVTGDLSVGSNSVIVNDTVATATVAQTISLAGLTNYTTGTINTGNSSGNSTFIGGIGNDTIYSTKGTTTLTGGAGADTFYFQSGMSPVTKIATITDFNKNEGDVIGYGGAALSSFFGTSTTAVTLAASAAAVSTNAATVTLTPNGYGYVAFSGTSTDFDTIAEKVQILHGYANGNSGAAGKYAFFQDGGSTYIWIDSTNSVILGDSATDTVIKLVGVPIPSASPTGTSSVNSASGVSGFGA